jgi:hypothetical protein
MSHGETKEIFVLAISPFTRGFGFTVFEGPTRPIDWGVKEARTDKNARCLQKMEALLDFYQPDVLIMENYAGRASRHCKRIQTLIDELAILPRGKKIKTRIYSRAIKKEFFSRHGAVTKHDVAQAIARWLPEFKPRLPRKRKIWMSEDPRMSIFDAIALVLTHFYAMNKKAKRRVGGIYE